MLILADVFTELWFRLCSLGTPPKPVALRGYYTRHIGIRTLGTAEALGIKRSMHKNISSPRMPVIAYNNTNVRTHTHAHTSCNVTLVAVTRTGLYSWPDHHIRFSGEMTFRRTQISSTFPRCSQMNETVRKVNKTKILNLAFQREKACTWLSHTDSTMISFAHSRLSHHVEFGKPEWFLVWSDLRHD